MERISWNAQELRRLRDATKETQEAVAARVGVSRATINRAERGRHASPQLLLRLCRLYDAAPNRISPDLL